MIGIFPPDGMAREFIACWYWDEVREHQCRAGADCDGCAYVQNLITGAIETGVIGHLVPVAGFAQPQPLSSLLAPYRTREGGLAEREEAARRRVLDAGPERWNRA